MTSGLTFPLPFLETCQNADESIQNIAYLQPEHLDTGMTTTMELENTLKRKFTSVSTEVNTSVDTQALQKKTKTDNQYFNASGCFRTILREIKTFFSETHKYFLKNTEKSSEDDIKTVLNENYGVRAMRSLCDQMVTEIVSKKQSILQGERENPRNSKIKSLLDIVKGAWKIQYMLKCPNSSNITKESVLSVLKETENYSIYTTVLSDMEASLRRIITKILKKKCANQQPVSRKAQFNIYIQKGTVINTTLQNQTQISKIQESTQKEFATCMICLDEEVPKAFIRSFLCDTRHTICVVCANKMFHESSVKKCPYGCDKTSQWNYKESSFQEPIDLRTSKGGEESNDVHREFIYHTYDFDQISEEGPLSEESE